MLKWDEWMDGLAHMPFIKSHDFFDAHQITYSGNVLPSQFLCITSYLIKSFHAFLVHFSGDIPYRWM